MKHASKISMTDVYILQVCTRRKKIVVLYYFDDCVYWYTSEALVKWFVKTLNIILHVKFLVFSHWFVSIGLSQLEDHSISVDPARYSTSVVAKYLDTATFKKGTNFYKSTLPSDMIFTKDYA